ncbi:hypothetical protein HK102_012100, partial [Quaeritorhiza haematococci]
MSSTKDSNGYVAVPVTDISTRSSSAASITSITSSSSSSSSTTALTTLAILSSAVCTRFSSRYVQLFIVLIGF